MKEIMEGLTSQDLGVIFKVLVVLPLDMEQWRSSDPSVYVAIKNLFLKIHTHGTMVLDFDPCTIDYIIPYMNSPEVQKALHANVTKVQWSWSSCNTVIYFWKDSPKTIVPILQELMENGLRVWVHSGDTYGRVPVTSTKYSLKKMNLTLKTPYHPWYHLKEVGGYTEEYKEGLTFVTVRGAGHEVSSYQPARALSLIMHFLNGTPLPNKR